VAALIRAADLFGVTLVALLLWCVAMVAIMLSSERLKDAVPPEDEERFRGLYFKETMDLLEGHRCYFRSRKLAKMHRGDGGEVGRWSGWLFRSMVAAEVLGVVVVALLVVSFPVP
jgi:hypothetical protein